MAAFRRCQPLQSAPFRFLPFLVWPSAGCTADLTVDQMVVAITVTALEKAAEELVLLLLKCPALSQIPSVGLLTEQD